MVSKRKEAEIKLIRKANRACAVGNLMLGKLNNWHDFLFADIQDLDRYPRKNLRAGVKGIQANLNQEIKKFCRQNFTNMTIDKLDKLYEDIKEYRDFALPLMEFETKYSEIKKEKLNGIPKHATIEISLWGMQFRFPEDIFSKDIYSGLCLLEKSSKEIYAFNNMDFNNVKRSRNELSEYIRQAEYGIRSSILSCFYLLESFLNGLAWEFCQNQDNLINLSNKKKTLIEDTNQATLKNKIFKYPEIISGEKLPDDISQWIFEWFEEFKPYRDSLVHPSPFQVPEKFGGYDKLKKIYSIDPLLAWGVAAYTCKICKVIFWHIYGDKTKLPNWLVDLNSNLETLRKTTFEK